MKLAEIRNLTDEEIRRKIGESREAMMKFRFQMPTGELTDYSQIRHTRRLVARLMTVLDEREKAAAGR